MIITLSPVRGLPGEPETSISVIGDTITIDGTSHDFSTLPEGAAVEAPGAHALFGRVQRLDGIIRCSVRVVLGDDAECQQPSDPGHWRIALDAGRVTIPAVRQPAPELAADP